MINKLNLNGFVVESGGLFVATRWRAKIRRRGAGFEPDIYAPRSVANVIHDRLNREVGFNEGSETQGKAKPWVLHQLGQKAGNGIHLTRDIDKAHVFESELQAISWLESEERATTPCERHYRVLSVADAFYCAPNGVYGDVQPCDFGQHLTVVGEIDTKGLEWSRPSVTSLKSIDKRDRVVHDLTYSALAHEMQINAATGSGKLASRVFAELRG